MSRSTQPSELRNRHRDAARVLRVPEESECEAGRCEIPSQVGQREYARHRAQRPDLRGARPAAAKSMTAALPRDMLRCLLHPAASSTTLLKTAFVRRAAKNRCISFTRFDGGGDASGSRMGKEQGGDSREGAPPQSTPANPWAIRSSISHSPPPANGASAQH
ncbi:hypothetical protein EK21DRAFT_89124 [Setomelanomma holmii]|uniref:Uncharacterized protein n=1 Tax=Setomelanomma holmii TaxID=210430 RepID=A0A9P4LN14_9PLEO|nr:hypothetical protein EK21DRAFT_89124 [Setomelanomma holmii]